MEKNSMHHKVCCATLLYLLIPLCLSERQPHSQLIIQAYSLHCILLYYISEILLCLSNKLKVWEPCVKQLHLCHFFNSNLLTL